MNNFNYRNMTPFKWFVLENFPFIENDFDAINNYQLFSKVVEYLNNTIDNMNLTGQQMENVTNAMTELENYVHNLDLQDEVNNKLDEMVENGTFNTILNQYSIGKETFRSRLYMSKIGRLNFTDYINNGYYAMQAGCYIGNNQYIFALIKNDNLGSARIFKIDFTTGMILDYRDITGIYHANGCCLKDGKLYFVQSFDNNDQDKNGIVEVDIATLEVTNTFTIDFNNETQYRIFAIGYDTKYNKFYLISYDYFYIADESFNVENIIQFQHPISRPLIRQGGTFYEDYVCYVSNNENAIVCFNRDGSLHHIIDIGQKQLNNFFGEIQNVNVYDNTLYFNSNLVHQTEQNLSLYQFFKANLSCGGLPQTMSRNVGFNNNQTISIEVNKTNYNLLTDMEKFTCNGTHDKPLETIAEALCYIDNETPYIIEVTDTNDYLEKLAIYNKNLIIKANNSKTGNIKILGSKVSMSNIKIENASYRTPLFGSSQDYITPLYITGNSEVWITGTSGFNYSQCVEDGMIYPCIVEGSTFYDGSSNFGNYHKFLKSFNNTTFPLITNSNLVSTNLEKIKNNKVNFSSYKITETKYTGVQTFDLTQIPLYTNAIRGCYVAFNVSGLGNTNYEKFTQNNHSRLIVKENADANSTRIGFNVEFNAQNNTLRVDPRKWNYVNNAWESDTTTQYYPFYEFDV